MINIWYIIAGSLFVLGIFLFIYFSTGKNYYRKKVEPIKEYEELRNKVTVRKPKEKEEQYISPFFNLGSIVSSIITLIIIIFVGITILSSFKDSLTTNTLANNVTNSITDSINNTLPIIGVIMIMLVLGIIVYYVSSFSNIGAI